MFEENFFLLLILDFCSSFSDYAIVWLSFRYVSIEIRTQTEQIFSRNHENDLLRSGKFVLNEIWEENEKCEQRKTPVFHQVFYVFRLLVNEISRPSREFTKFNLVRVDENSHPGELPNRKVLLKC